jgi:hypothetical protein
VAVAATMMRGSQCRACRLDLDARAEKCWFCSTPVLVASGRAATVQISAEADDQDGILFARGVLIGIAAVLVPFVVHLTALSG